MDESVETAESIAWNETSMITLSARNELSSGFLFTMNTY